MSSQAAPSIAFGRERIQACLALLFSQPGLALAMQPCADGTSPCPTPWQVLLLIVLPLSLAVLALRSLERSARSRRFKVIVTVLLSICLGAWLLVAMAAFSMFLAPCAPVCWLRPSTW